MKFKNGEIVATAEDGKVIVLDDELTVKQQFKGYKEYPYAIDFDNDNIIVGYQYGMVHLYNRRSNERKKVTINFETNLISVQINKHNRSVWSVTLNENFAASAGNDDTIQVYSLIKKKTVHTFKHSHTVSCVSYGPVNKDYANKIISSSWDKTVRIWNLENGQMENEFKHDGWILTRTQPCLQLHVIHMALRCGRCGIKRNWHK